MPRRTRHPLPAGTWDTHCHVFGPEHRYPLAARRNYTPAVAPLSAYRELMRALGVARAVLVQPSVYGTDHAALQDALQEGGVSFRGVAVPAAGIDDAGLRALHALGVRAVRLNLVNPAVISIDEAVALAARTASLGWHLQVQVDLARQGVGTLLALEQRVSVPLVLDHFGLADPTHPPAELLRMVESGRCWVKLSAPYRLRSAIDGAADVAPLVRRLVAANPERLLWGSDWPHTEQQQAPQAADWAERLLQALPDDAVRRRVFAENARTLYA